MTDVRFNKVAKALSDPQRFAVLQLVVEGAGKEVACKVLVERFPVSQATISHHLKELGNAELIEVRREGQCAFVSARTATLTAYLSELQRRLTAKK